METTLITGALIRNGKDILLVEQQAPHDPVSNWALPGGRIEKGEFFHDALIREVREETGLMVKEIGQIIYACQIIDRENERQLIAMIHEVTAWEGQLEINDPDSFILTAKFMPHDEAIECVGSGLDFAPMRDPIVAYLRGDMAAGATWFYRRLDEDNVELETRLGG